jgi:hypothetical protein
VASQKELSYMELIFRIEMLKTEGILNGIIKDTMNPSLAINKHKFI